MLTYMENTNMTTTQFKSRQKGADYDFVVLSRNDHDFGAVLVTSGKVSRFAAQWPCSGLPDDMGVIFTFQSNGDLVDIEWFESWSGKTVAEPDGIDGAAMVALSQDAQTYMLTHDS